MIVLFLSFLGILLSLVILRFNPKNKFLAAFYFLNSFYGVFSASVFYYKIPFISVILLIHFAPLFFLLGPCLFLYIRFELTKSNQIKRSDLIHFLPFFLALIVIFPYVFQTLEFKYRFITFFHQSNIKAVESMNVLIIPVKYFLIAKNILLFGYILFLSIWYLLIFQKDRLELNKGKIKWLNFFIPSLLLSNLLITLFTAYTLNNISSGVIIQPYPILIVASIVGSLLFVSILFFPSTLYGEVKKQVDTMAVYRPDELQIQKLVQDIQEYVNGRSYLTSDFTKPKMMSDLKISDRLFLYYFNEYLGISFAQWKSDLRIDCAKNLAENGYLKSHTIESLALSVGFRSRNKFTEAFKKRTGINPSEVIC